MEKLITFLEEEISTTLDKIQNLRKKQIGRGDPTYGLVTEAIATDRLNFCRRLLKALNE